ncbi:Putative aliphatic sulfonates transport permease protein SsuC [Grimontia celer]|uniref:Putative aliphatic sulfonates transport permease protein SsuC n=1 Tax=Grimontia celer TaxID=1796497 RepID=A0A128F1G2_9GAMM|nr:ABC transporter permease subunit [Grimontia celer]CZF80609.1 Putative aliphatic sulfonates transport permease protein SsuC [Grimontia celer]
MSLSSYQRYLLPVLLLVFWQWSAALVNSAEYPTPVQVYNAFVFELLNEQMLSHLGITLWRVFLSFIISMVLGVIFGILMGRFPRLNELSDPLLILALNIPALVTILLCYLSIGLVETAAVTAVALNKIPTVVAMIREGARVVDNDLMDVAKVFRLSPTKRFFIVFLPQLYPYIMASARTGLSLIWKIVLVVELLGRSNGVGFKLHTMFQFFDIAGILAYTFAFVTVIFLLESLLFRPLDKVVSRGRA